jgi:hypothetical protein
VDVRPGAEGLTVRALNLLPNEAYQARFHREAALLEQGVRQELNPADVPVGAQRVTARSPEWAVALSLLEPVVGDLYTHAGDEVTPFPLGWPWSEALAFRVAADATIYGMLGTGAVLWNRSDLRNVGPLLVGVGAICAVTVRGEAVLVNLADLRARNRLAATGYRFEVE